MMTQLLLQTEGKGTLILWQTLWLVMYVVASGIYWISVTLYWVGMV